MFKITLHTNEITISTDNSNWLSDSNNKNIWTKDLFIYADHDEAIEKGFFLNDEDKKIVINLISEGKLSKGNNTLTEFWRLEDLQKTIDNYLSLYK